jgi:hypothetical protein
MEDFIKLEIIKNIKTAKIIANTGFLLLNLFILILIYFIFRNKHTKLAIIKYRLVILCFIDAFMRLINIKYYFEDNEIYKEVMFTFLKTLQFYLLFIKIIEYMAINFFNNHINKITQFLFCSTFLIINLPYEKLLLLSSAKIFICLVQNISFLIYSLVLYNYIIRKVIGPISKLIKENQIKDDSYIRLIAVQLPILFIYIFLFIINICFEFLGDSIVISYIKLIKIVLIESPKLLILLYLYSLIYISEKINGKRDSSLKSAISFENIELIYSQ